MLIAATEAATAPPAWAAAPFAVLLLAIAIFPLVQATHHWWENNRNKLIVAVVLALVTLGYYATRGDSTGGGAFSVAIVGKVLSHAVLDEYVPFMVVLIALYAITGGIVVRGDLRATPRNNTLILAAGGVLASFIGTTGASMLLIRFLLRTNSERKLKVHTVIFFIFAVSNIGGLLTPIGDPPLLLGYLKGVPFLWPMTLWGQWLIVLGGILLIYFAYDSIVYRREPIGALMHDITEIQPLRIAGGLNFVWLVFAVAAVATIQPGARIPGTETVMPVFAREGAMLLFTGLAYFTTPRALREENRFEFGPVWEVGALFIGFFITMQTPIEMLHSVAPRLAEQGLTHPWQFFWATGILSSFLDNAPTYVIFLETANQLTTAPGPGIIQLTTGDYIRSDLLAAISCGAVFMGANTYIGNGPNFMVKAIAERSGVRMPSFFEYMLYSGAILMPLFIAVTFVFFRT